VKNKLGYTLIEVMVAMFLISMAAITFSAMMPMAAKGSHMVSNYQQASSLVQNKIDEIRAVGYGRIDYTDLLAAGIIDSSPTSSPYSFTGVGGLDTILPGASGTISVSNYSTTIKQVTVTVSWAGGGIKQDTGTLSAVALVAVT
jgi:prepilin-type N-terminal cleavage/methylation domain-containing protein